MAKLDRVHQKIFASTAPASDVGVIGSLHEGNPTEATSVQDIQSLAAFEAGIRSIVIGENSPIIEEDNALYKLITYQLAYLFQNGIPEWSPLVEYYSMAIVRHGNNFYWMSGISSINEEPGTGPWMRWYNDPSEMPVNYIPRDVIQAPLKYNGHVSMLFATLDDEWTDVITVPGVENNKGVHISFRSFNPSLPTIIRISAGSIDAWGEIRIIKTVSGVDYTVLHTTQNIYVAGPSTPTFITPGALGTSDLYPVGGGALSTYKLQIKLMRNGANNPSFSVENLQMDIVGL